MVVEVSHQVVLEMNSRKLWIFCFLWEHSQDMRVRLLTLKLIQSSCDYWWNSSQRIHGMLESKTVIKIEYRSKKFKRPPKVWLSWKISSSLEELKGWMVGMGVPSIQPLWFWLSLSFCELCLNDYQIFSTTLNSGWIFWMFSLLQSFSSFTTRLNETWNAVFTQSALKAKAWIQLMKVEPLHSWSFLLSLALNWLSFTDSHSHSSDQKYCETQAVLLTGGSNSSLSCWPNCSVETGKTFVVPFLSAAKRALWCERDAFER